MDAPRPLRIPDDLARSLTRLVESRGIPKSWVVREALSHYLAAGKADPDAPPVLAGDLRRLMDALAEMAERRHQSPPGI